MRVYLPLNFSPFLFTLCVQHLGRVQEKPKLLWLTKVKESLILPKFQLLCDHSTKNCGKIENLPSNNLGALLITM